MLFYCIYIEFFLVFFVRPEKKLKEESKEKTEKEEEKSKPKAANVIKLVKNI